MLFSGYITSRGVAQSRGSFILSFLKNLCTVLHKLLSLNNSNSRFCSARLRLLDASCNCFLLLICIPFGLSVLSIELIILHIKVSILK